MVGRDDVDTFLGCGDGVLLLEEGGVMGDVRGREVEESGEVVEERGMGLGVWMGVGEELRSGGIEVGFRGMRGEELIWRSDVGNERSFAAESDLVQQFKHRMKDV
ncbi:hypothetical protein, partial [Paenibacillus xylanexedens]|uniref:hypothetical protein n=1 Tax=Paenibacillus xylanexedens TaxID=528191 RepID=UPI0011A3CB1E